MLGFQIPSQLSLQETPFVVACTNIDYLRLGNVKFNDKSLTLRDQEEYLLRVVPEVIRLPAATCGEIIHQNYSSTLSFPTHLIPYQRDHHA